MQDQRNRRICSSTSLLRRELELFPIARRYVSSNFMHRTRRIPIAQFIASQIEFAIKRANSMNVPFRLLDRRTRQISAQPEIVTIAGVTYPR